MVINIKFSIEPLSPHRLRVPFFAHSFFCAALVAPIRFSEVWGVKSAVNEVLMLPFLAFEKMALGYVTFCLRWISLRGSFVSPFILFVVLKKSPFAPKNASSNFDFSGAKMLVLGRVLGGSSQLVNDYWPWWSFSSPKDWVVGARSKWPKLNGL